MWLLSACEKHNMAIRNADVFIHLLEWLVEGRHLVEKAEPADKILILHAILNWFWGSKHYDHSVTKLLRQLCVFKRVRRGELDTAT